MRVVQSLFSASLSVILLVGAAQAAGASESGRGRDIHFRGPIFTVSRDEASKIVQLTIGVNNGQVDVMVNAWTEVIIGRGFTSDRTQLELGDFVEVSGFFTTTGSIVAQRIHVESRDALDLQGRIEAISDNLIEVNGLDLLIYEDSEIRPSSGDPSTGAAGLAVGQEVRVRAGADDGSWRIYQLEYGPRTVDSEPLRLEGIFLGFYDPGSGVPNRNLLMIDVGIRNGEQPVATPVARNQDTVIEGELARGRLVQIEWTFSRSPGNQLLPVASHIVVDSNGNDNVFDDSTNDGSPVDCELKGSIRGLGPGAGGHLQFYIQETLIRLTAQTQVRDRAGNAVSRTLLADGLEVEVTGVRLQDRTVQASRIEIQQGAGAGDDVSGGSNDTGGNSGDDTGSGTDSPGGGQTDPGNGSGDVGGAPPDGNGGNAGDVGNGGSTPGGDTGETESITREITGVITELHRLEDETVDSITVNGIVVEVTAQTVIVGGESDPSGSSALAVDQAVQIEAVERTDGSLLAKRIEIKD